MNIKELLQITTKKLKENNIEYAYMIANSLLEYVLNKRRMYLIINEDEELEENVIEKYNEKIDLILEGEPLQYIKNNQEFMGINFYVNRYVLVPQPDTEIVCEKAIEICKTIKNKKIKILDLCTGSGAIAVSICKNVENVQMYASDISKKALYVAEKNVLNNNVQVNLVESDMFENIKEANFDIIVSNPPYIKTDVIGTLPETVKREPILALDGGKDGLDLYRKIAKEAYKHIENGGYLVLEIGYDQKNDVTKLLENEKKYVNIETIKDLSGNDRCIIAKIKL